MPMRHRFDRFEVLITERQLLVDGQPAALGARAFDVLVALIQHHERLVSKNELLDLVWGKLVVEEANVQVQISTLRKLLGPHAIATIPGRGYRFSMPLHGNAEDGRLPPAMPAPSTLSAAPVNPRAPALQTNLPEALLPLIGRDDDVAALGALIAGQRLLTVVGAGGVGKSRVAQWLLHERRGAFEHGVAWVDLAPLSDPALVASSIASALGLPVGGGDATQGLLGALERLSLLVALDNAEHVIDEVARVVRAVYETAPGVHMIVTSQAPLRLGIESVYRLGPLAVPESALPVDEAIGYGAVALFAQRAQAADRRFSLNPQNVATVIQLCQRLDGLALAIELAASRVPLLGLATLAQALDERFRVLTSGARGAAARQQTLRGALEWSHALLGGAEQAVFRRLGVFVGGFSLDLAQQVASDDRLDRWTVVDALAALVDRSLVSVDGQDPPRYRLLETPRAFALEQLAASGEMASIRRRHALSLRALLEAAQVDYFSGRQRVDAWSRQLQPDLDNARAALGWALEHDAESAVALAADLALALAGTQLHEAWRLLQSSAALVTDAVPLALQARWHVEAAYVAIASQPGRAMAMARRAVELHRALDDRRGLYRSLSLLISCHPGEPRDEQRSALAELRALEDPGWPPIVRARGAHAMSVLLGAEGDLAKAIEWKHQRDALHELAGDSAQLPMGQASLMDAELAAGRIDAAIRRGVALEAQLRGTRNLSVLPFAALNLTAAWLAKGDAAPARVLARTYWPMAQQFDMQAYWADYLALMAALEGRPAAAARLLGYGDAGYHAKAYTREVNEARAAQRAEQLSAAQLGRTAFDRLRAAGAALRDDDVTALAFAEQDTTG